MNARQNILKILEDYDKRNVSLELVVDKAFSDLKADHRDKRFIFEIVYGVVRNRLALDYVLNTFLDDKKFRDSKHLMRILRLGMYQIVHLDPFLLCCVPVPYCNCVVLHCIIIYCDA